MNGTFIIIDGIDGSGKSTIMNAWNEHLAEKGRTIYSLKNYWCEHHTHPPLEEVMAADVILSAEPTTVGIGLAIRQELIATGAPYSPNAIANAYALDRLILYTKLLNPLRKAGKIILQDRSVSTSLCYQSIQEGGLSMDEIAHIEGNAFALEHAPDHLIIADVAIEISLDRLGARLEKQDNAMFEKQSFLEKAKSRFLDPMYQSYFTDRGSEVHTLDTSADLDIMKQKAIDLLDSINDL